MWSSKLFWKLFLVYVGLSLALTASFLVFGVSSHRTEINRQVEQRLHNSAVVLRSHVNEILHQALDPMADDESRGSKSAELQQLVQQLAANTETRFTIVGPDGVVVADSERNPAAMENHADRPELIQASRQGKGIVTRKSPTLQVDMYYLALPVRISDNRQAYVRVAVQMETINDQVAAVRRFLWLLAIALAALATALTYAVVGRIIHPLAQLTARAQAFASGQNEDPMPVQGKDEVGLLAEAFNHMQSELSERFRQLRENNQQMATVLGSMHDGVIAVDANENVVLANDASRELLDLDEDKQVEGPLPNIVNSRALRKVVQQCLTTGNSVQTQFQLANQPGRDLAVRGTCLPGDPSPGVVVVLHDISELRRLENLRQEFVANVSHELKTPLASIKAYAETLKLGAMDDPENNMRFVDQIEEQSERLHQLILDMLQIARIESGEAAFEITDVPIQQVVDDCVAQHREAAQRKGIGLIVEPPREPLHVHADEDGLRAILDNLVGNAVKYTQADGMVTIRWDQEEAFACIEVEDTGMGIAPEDQARVFERFFRVDKARSRDMGGTGLGLSIVKHLAQSFGGSVVLISKLGEGSTFRVRLPLEVGRMPSTDGAVELG